MCNSSSLPLVIFLLCLSFSAPAQSPPVSPALAYFLSVHAGGLLGKNGQGSSLTTSLIQGVRYKRMALGLGVGYDAYVDWRTLPVFASLSGDIFHVRENAFFLQLNAGYCKIWNPAFADDSFYFYDGPHPSINALAGYRICAGKYDVYLSAGYKFQRIRYGWSWGGPGSRTFVERDIKRVSVQIGFGI